MSEVFNPKNRYSLNRIIDGNKTVLAEFKRTTASLFSLSRDTIVTLGESECFILASRFNSLSPRYSAHSDEVYTLQTAGIKIQARKIQLGYSLDTPRNPGVDNELK